MELDMDSYRAGFIAALKSYAHWKDGTQYVGTTGTTLSDAIKEAEKELQTATNNDGSSELYDRSYW